MSHNEAMTRAAARAIGRDVTGYVWSDFEGRLVRRLALAGRIVFAPLADAADAFTVESDLRLNVTYLVNGDRIALCVTCVKHAELGHVVTVPLDSDKGAMLEARMLAVTQFAALYDIAENEK